MTSFLSEAQHRIVQVVFSGTPSGYETHETPRPPISQSRPNCFKDLPEIRDEPFADVISVGYIPSNTSQCSIDLIAPVHGLSGIGPSTTSIPDYGCQAELSMSYAELSSAPPSRRKTPGSSGNRSYSTLAGSRSTPGSRLDSIPEGDEPLPSPSISSDTGDARSCLGLIGPHTSSLETNSSSSSANYEEMLRGQYSPCPGPWV